jgi:predicted GNAT family acetyltransferase
MVKKNKPTTEVCKSKAKKISTPSVAAETKKFVEGVGRALRRAAKVARKVAKEHGTPIYVWENGKVVAKKP